MDPASLAGGLFGGIGGIIGGVLGQAQQQNAQQFQRDTLERMLQQYQNIPLPVLQKLVPTLLGQSAESQVSTDPKIQAAQMQALKGLQDEVSSGGMTQADQAAMNLAANDASQRERTQRSAVQNMLAARGLGGSGAAVGAMLAGEPQAQDRQAQAGQEAQVAARTRALQALQESGSLAGQIRGQQFTEADRAAQAKDLFTKYNATALDNGQQYNNGVAQQQYNNQLGKQNAVAGAAGSLATNVGATGAQNAAFTAGLGSGIGQFGAGVANQFSGGLAAAAPAAAPPSPTMTDPTKLPNPSWSTSY